MVTIKKTTTKDRFIHVRYRQPSQFTRVRTPGWAARVAQSVSSGAKVRMGRTSAGTWLVQSVLIRRGNGKTVNDAKRLAAEIRRKIDE